MEAEAEARQRARQSTSKAYREKRADDERRPQHRRRRRHSTDYSGSESGGGSARRSGDDGAARHRRRGRRHNRDAYSEFADAFPVWKTLAVLACVGACFAILYPKMFHPMVMGWLGYNTDSQDRSAPAAGDRHPGGSQPRPGGPMGAFAPPQTAAGATGGTGGGGNKGTWQWLLPMYSIGVIGFLLYTLSKMFYRKPRAAPAGRPYSLRYNSARDRFEVPGARRWRHQHTGDRSAGSGGGASDSDSQGGGGRLGRLQSRLADTEDAMQKILGQLQQLSAAGLDVHNAERIKQHTMESLGELQADAAAATAERERTAAADRHKGNSKGKKTEYLADLDEALSQFKVLTETYVQRKVTEALGREQGDKDGDGDEADTVDAGHSGAPGDVGAEPAAAQRRDADGRASGQSDGDSCTESDVGNQQQRRRKCSTDS